MGAYKSLYVCILVMFASMQTTQRKSSQKLRKYNYIAKFVFVSTDTLRTLTDRQTFSWKIQPSMLKDS